ncbi:MAG: hypothetical protein WKG00_06230 [Polyangiaceae bacterium]
MRPIISSCRATRSTVKWLRSGVLATQPERWQRFGKPTLRVWTDDFSNPLAVLMF